MRNSVWLVVPVALFATNSQAIVIRHSQSDSKYRVDLRSIPALGNLPDQGHGTLIASRWVVTAAHAVSSMQDSIASRYVTINGKRRGVSRIVVHPGFAHSWREWQKLFAEVKTADPQRFAVRHVMVVAAMRDIALLKLAEHVTDVKPMPVYWRKPPIGAVARVYGEGATGTDSTGAPESASHRTDLRRAMNRLTQTDGPWLRFVFNCDDGDALSGAPAGGDSGGPVTIVVSGHDYLAGVTHGLDAPLKDEKAIVRQLQNGTFRMGRCGQTYAAARAGIHKLDSHGGRYVIQPLR